MSFELLDAILQENSTTVNGGNSQYPSNNESYAILDGLVENAMKSSLRSIIIENGNDINSVANHLSVVEDTQFNEDQIIDYMNDNINPVIGMLGVEENNYGPVAVNLAMYDICEILDESSKKYDSFNIEQELHETFEVHDIENKQDKEDYINEARSILEDYSMADIMPSIYELAEVTIMHNQLLDEGKYFSMPATKHQNKKELSPERKAAREQAKKNKAAVASSRIESEKATRQGKKRVQSNQRQDRQDIIKSVKGRQRMDKFNTVKSNIMSSPKHKWTRRAAGAAALGTAGALAYKKYKDKQKVSEMVSAQIELSGKDSYTNSIMRLIETL